ncbi:hypothetical protein ACWGOK_25040 [Streptomyces eurythermus]
MPDSIPQTHSTPPPDPHEALGDAARRLRNLLRDMPGDHHLLPDTEPWVQVVSCDGDVLTAPGTDAADPDAVAVVQAVLARAEIHAYVEQYECAIGPAVVITLRTAEDVNKLVHTVIATLPEPLRKTRELTAVMREHGFYDPAAVYTRHHQVKGIQLTLDDARKVRAALGEDDAKLAVKSPSDLYVAADDFAQFLNDRLTGNPVDVSAYPARGDLCDNCMDHLLVLGPLSVEQTEQLTSGLARTLLELP